MSLPSDAKMNRIEQLKAVIAEVHELYAETPTSAGKWNDINDIYRKHGYHPKQGWLDAGVSIFSPPNCS